MNEKIVIGEDRIARIRFNDWASMIDYAEYAPCEHRRDRTSDEKMHGDWTLGLGFNESLALARSGWKDGAEKARKLSSVMFNRVSRTIKKRRTMLDVQGMGFDVGTYLSGQPECWVRFDHVKARKVIKILFDCGASGGISGSVMRARGAAVASLIELLEFSGFGVELVAMPMNASEVMDDPKTKRLDARVLVKPATQKLDMARIMFACAHPAFLRRIGFRVMETAPLEYQFGGYGYPTKNLPEKDRELADIYIGGSHLNDAQWDNEESARKWVIDKLQEQGVQFNGGAI